MLEDVTELFSLPCKPPRVLRQHSTMYDLQDIIFLQLGRLCSATWFGEWIMLGTFGLNRNEHTKLYFVKIKFQPCSLNINYNYKDTKSRFLYPTDEHRPLDHGQPQHCRLSVITGE